MNTLHDLSRIINNALPDHDFDTDNDGQVIIYTGLKLWDDGTLTRFADEVTA